MERVIYSLSNLQAVGRSFGLPRLMNASTRSFGTWVGPGTEGTSIECAFSGESGAGGLHNDYVMRRGRGKAPMQVAFLKKEGARF